MKWFINRGEIERERERGATGPACFDTSIKSRRGGNFPGHAERVNTRSRLKSGSRYRSLVA
jgi:hypothetical protein